MHTHDRSLIKPQRINRPRVIIHGQKGTEESNDPNPILKLQKMIGNRAVQRLLSGEMAGASLDEEPGQVIAGGDQWKGSSRGQTSGGDGQFIQREDGTRTHQTIRFGSSGPDVEEAQAKLNSQGVDPPLAVDGIFGPHTLSAVIEFQRANDLAPDGIVGPLTWGALDQGGTGPTPTTTQPALQKSTVSGPTTVKNGGYTWSARWSLQNANNTTNGWIVQRLLVRQNVTDAGNAAVTPGQGIYGGFPASWTPYWEGWQVRDGNIFVGKTTAPHNADTYSQGPVGEHTQGTTEELGQADFYPGITTPESWPVNNAAPAWALPMTKSDPGLSGGTGELDHNLTATWNSVTGDGQTTATTI
jgi:peptidoglycan hydrolase-like protein with peptidoglycan-binding domain